MTSAKPLTLMFKDDGAVPNNPSLPALLYKSAVALGRDPEGELERLFAANGWGHGQWRDGIYPFPHYHSMIHETLGIARGTAKVRLGGDKGEVVELSRRRCRGAAGRHRASATIREFRSGGDRRLSARGRL